MNLVFKALSHPVRRQIIAMLRDCPLTSGDIAARFDMAWPSVTGHLTVLKDAGLVETERARNSVRYRLNISAAEEAVRRILRRSVSVPVDLGRRQKQPVAILHCCAASSRGESIARFDGRTSRRN
jgi:DNA-binding transcriptional ArsR family regulator